MSANLSAEQFRDWNERMMQIHDNEAFHSTSNWLVRTLALQRVNAILRLLNCRADDRVLDVGCGAGIILNAVQSRHKTGVDLCSRMLERARRRCGPDVKLVEASAELLPFEDRSFDRVLCSEVIGHVQTPEFVVRELQRVLKPDGVLVVTAPASERIVAIKKFLKRFGLYQLLLGSRKQGVYCPPANDDWYLHHFTPATLEALLSAGFEVERNVCIPHRVVPVHYILHCRPRPLPAPMPVRLPVLQPAAVSA